MPVWEWQEVQEVLLASLRSLSLGAVMPIVPSILPLALRRARSGSATGLGRADAWPRRIGVPGLRVWTVAECAGIGNDVFERALGGTKRGACSPPPGVARLAEQAVIVVEEGNALHASRAGVGVVGPCRAAALIADAHEPALARSFAILVRAVAFARAARSHPRDVRVGSRTEGRLLRPVEK